MNEPLQVLELWAANARLGSRNTLRVGKDIDGNMVESLTARDIGVAVKFVPRGKALTVVIVPWSAIRLAVVAPEAA